MDGASKFVRGDAIAAIIIMLVNILGGFVIGMLQHQLTMVEALQRYALLTVGAGLAIQILPCWSLPQGLIVTRSGSDTSLAPIFSAGIQFQRPVYRGVIMSSFHSFPTAQAALMLVAGALIGSSFLVRKTKRRKKNWLWFDNATTATNEPETPRTC
jgi:flagellar biosynthesis protein FlhA